MLQQKAGFTVDVTPRKILLDYKQYECICEALAGITSKARVRVRDYTERRKKLMRYIVTEWKKQDEVRDERRN